MWIGDVELVIISGVIASKYYLYGKRSYWSRCNYL